MAKKRRSKPDEEEIDFKIPKFDEKKYVQKERRNIKTLFISFILGLIIAFISFGFWMLLEGSFLRWELVLLVGVFNASWIRYVFARLQIDLTDFGRKGWFGSYAIYFLTWLLVFIVLVNPPIYDDADPVVTIATLPDMQEPGGTVKIVARITDNVGITKDNIHFNIIDPNQANHTPSFTYTDAIFMYEYTNPQNIMGHFSYTLTATDASGRMTKKTGNFTYANDTIRLSWPADAQTPPGPPIIEDTPIRFSSDANIDRLYYTVNNGPEINVTLGDKNFYETSARYVGWEPDSNATVHVYGEVYHYFTNLKQEFNNTIIDNTTYYFNVSNTPNIGIDLDIPEITLPQPEIIRVPGFELIIFLISLIATAIIIKYSRKDKHR